MKFSFIQQNIRTPEESDVFQVQKHNHQKLEYFIQLTSITTTAIVIIEVEIASKASAIYFRNTVVYIPSHFGKVRIMIFILDRKHRHLKCITLQHYK